MFFFSSRRRHTRCALGTGVQTCALPILTVPSPSMPKIPGNWIIRRRKGRQALPVRPRKAAGAPPQEEDFVLSSLQDITGLFPGLFHRGEAAEIGRASCRERVGQYG